MTKPSTITRGDAGPVMSIEVENSDLETLMALAIREIDTQLSRCRMHLPPPEKRSKHAIMRVESDELALIEWRNLALAIADVVE